MLEGALIMRDLGPAAAVDAFQVDFCQHAVVLGLVALPLATADCDATSAIMVDTMAINTVTTVSKRSLFGIRLFFVSHDCACRSVGKRVIRSWVTWRESFPITLTRSGLLSIMLAAHR